jgi:tetratricopeptide (TPR) repeat protein
VISSVQDYPVSHYFNLDGAQRFFIPKYQREYVWKRENWEALFNDLEDAPAGHFLGSIICVNSQKDSMAACRLELIDGQQRFTTISLLFCALYEKLKAHPEPDDDFNVELVNLKNRIFVKPDNTWRFEPSEQAQNKADFQKVLSDLFPKLVAAPKGLSYFGNRRIAKAFAYFRDRMQPLTIPQALALLGKLKDAVLVKIEVPSHSDAFVLFETINNRGIPLSAIDIIKNNLLAELDKRPAYGIDRAFEEWKDLVDLLPDPVVQERFLRQLYNAYKYLKRVEVKGCPRATRSNLIHIYDSQLRRRPVWLFDALRGQGKAYASLIRPELAREEWGEAAATALTDLQHLGAAPAYAFLLWTRQVAQHRGWPQADAMARMATVATKWFFWRNLTDTPPTRELDTMFMELISHLLGLLRAREVSGLDAFMHQARAWLLTKAASEAQCEKSLQGDVYTENYEATRFMLCKLEEAHQTVETRRDLWAHDASERPVITVEHILPKTENLGPAWVAMLEAPGKGSADDVRRRCAHQLGNLTLSGYNAKLGTMEFVKKRDRKNDKGDSIGYRNGLYLNAELATRDEWNEDAIQARTIALSSEVKAILGLWNEGPA